MSIGRDAKDAAWATELDRAASSLPEFVPSPERAERVRTELLAAAGQAPQKARPAWGRRLAVAAAIGLPLAAAASTVAWIRLRPMAISAPAATTVEHRGTIDAQIGARYSWMGSAPNEVVRVFQGTLIIQVAPLGPGERFRVVTSDAEVEVHGTRFEVEVDEEHLSAVRVLAGVVELRPAVGRASLLRAGEHWQTPIAMATAPEPEPTRVVEPEVPLRGKRAPSLPAEPPMLRRRANAPPLPGEPEFRAGWAALGAGDTARAAARFAAACQAAGHHALAEDACFWQGAALARSRQDAQAARALQTFLSAHPRSARAGEAAAMLGWIRLAAGDLAQAQRYFRTAIDDRVPKVRKSARDGLDEIARRKPGPGLP